MKPAYKAAVEYFLCKGYSISVWDSEEWQVTRARAGQEEVIYDAIDSVEMSELRVRNQDGEYVGTLAVIPGWGMAPEETVSDYSPAEGEINDWFEEYFNSVN